MERSRCQRWSSSQIGIGLILFLALLGFCYSLDNDFIVLKKKKNLKKIILIIKNSYGRDTRFVEKSKKSHWVKSSLATFLNISNNQLGRETNKTHFAPLQPVFKTSTKNFCFKTELYQVICFILVHIHFFRKLTTNEWLVWSFSSLKVFQTRKFVFKFCTKESIPLKHWTWFFALSGYNLSMDRNTFSPNTVQTSQIGDKPIVRKGYICGFQSKRYKKKNGIVLERDPDATWTNE